MWQQHVFRRAPANVGPKLTLAEFRQIWIGNQVWVRVFPHVGFDIGHTCWTDIGPKVVHRLRHIVLGSTELGLELTRRRPDLAELGQTQPYLGWL